jgi:signal transduction histidine kinase
MDAKKRLDQLQQEVEQLKQLLHESRSIASDYERIVNILDDIHVFKCVKDKVDRYDITFSKGKLDKLLFPETEQLLKKRFKDSTISKKYMDHIGYFERAFEGETVRFKDFIVNKKSVYSTVLMPFSYNEDGTVKEILGITHNITELTNAKDEQQKNSAILDRIIEFNPYSIQILNAEGYHIRENKAFHELFKAVPGKDWSIFKDEMIRKQGVYEKLIQVLEGKVVVTEPVWYNAHAVDPQYKDNPICIGSVIFPVIVKGSKIEYIVSMHEDVTFRVNAQSELVKAKEKAEESDRLKSAFLANMSHEIRTPMNGIMGFAELLKTPNLTGEKQQRYISIIEQSGVRMLNIINDLINISKLESGQMEVVYSELNVDDQFEFLYSFFEPEAKNKGVDLLVRLPMPSSHALLISDQEKIYAVLTNLIKNAIKFTNTGTIEFGYEYKDEYFEFFVKDTGIGISPEKQKVIFERFIQADSSLTSEYEGSGLGLAIAKAYVEMLGGTIWVESEPGIGTQFYFTIPENKPGAIIRESVMEDGNLSLSKKKAHSTILIAEDDEYSLMYLTQVLESMGFNLVFARTGLEAIDLCSKNRNIRLILMDIKMPLLDGHLAAKQIKEFLPDLPIIAQTAFALESEKEKFIQTFDDYIIKPIDVEALKRKVVKYLMM